MNNDRHFQNLFLCFYHEPQFYLHNSIEVVSVHVSMILLIYFLRACYILKCGEGSSLANYVAKLAFQLGQGEECAVSIQLRALQCLMAVSCTDTLEELTGRNIDDIRCVIEPCLSWMV
jgi:hypothetical protein